MSLEEISRRTALRTLGSLALLGVAREESAFVLVSCESPFGKEFGIKASEIDLELRATSPDQSEYFERAVERHMRTPTSVRLRSTSFPHGSVFVTYRTAPRPGDSVGAPTPFQGRVFPVAFDPELARIAIRGDEAEITTAGKAKQIVAARMFLPQRLYQESVYSLDGAFSRYDAREKTFLEKAADANKRFTRDQPIDVDRRLAWDADVPYIFAPYSQNATGPDDIDAPCLRAGFRQIFIHIIAVREAAVPAPGAWLRHTTVPLFLDPERQMQSVWSGLSSRQRERYSLPNEFVPGRDYTLVVWYRPTDISAPSSLPPDGYIVINLLDTARARLRPLLFSQDKGFG